MAATTRPTYGRLQFGQPCAANAQGVPCSGSMHVTEARMQVDGCWQVTKPLV